MRWLQIKYEQFDFNKFQVDEWKNTNSALIKG